MSPLILAYYHVIQGCCWAFVAAAAVQVAVNLNVGWRSELSVQELIDCDKIDRGCAGGNQVSQRSLYLAHSE